MENLSTFQKILSGIDDLFLRVKINNIKPEHKIIDDLGIDSLTRVTIFYEIQDHYDQDRDQMDAANWQTINDILLYMNELK